jgi:hypothetical protein
MEISKILQRSIGINWGRRLSSIMLT